MDCNISLYTNTVLAGTLPPWRIQITFKTQVLYAMQGLS